MSYYSNRNPFAKSATPVRWYDYAYTCDKVRLATTWSFAFFGALTSVDALFYFYTLLGGFYVSTKQMSNVWRSFHVEKGRYAKKGFSVGKAAVGGFLLGPVGLLGGALGKKKIWYACGKCGFQHEYNA